MNPHSKAMLGTFHALKGLESNGFLLHSFLKVTLQDPIDFKRRLGSTLTEHELGRNARLWRNRQMVL